jgi:CubicO group peptidase (beta-lactamase class C family)
MTGGLGESTIPSMSSFHSRKFLLPLLAGLLLVLLAPPTHGRTWSDASGKFSIEAELVEVKDGQVVLRKADGSEIKLPVAKLSAADRKHLETVDAPAPAAATVVEADPEISALLEEIRQQSDVPALAGAIVTSEGLVAMGVTGVRKRGTDTLATAGDLWHLGSDTKAMTATLVARLVEQGKLKWDTTLADVFADGRIEIHPDREGVTIRHLLSHRAGLPGSMNLPEYLGADGRRERLRVVRQELAKAPQAAPGSAYEYSNLGYVIAGAIVEKVVRKRWQDAMVGEVFRPLGMSSVGFGGLGTPGKVDQPWPHGDDGQPVPGNGPTVDNPAVMGPAGMVHCTIQDWAKYVADFLGGTTGKPALLKAESYKELSSPPFGGDYALGWTVLERPWGGGTVLTHSGSNTMNFCVVWMAPQRDFAVLVCTNQGGDAAQKACDAAASALILRHGESLKR